MSTITKKQTALALVAVVFATAMVAGTFVVSIKWPLQDIMVGSTSLTVATHQYSNLQMYKQQVEHHQLLDSWK